MLKVAPCTVVRAINNSTFRKEREKSKGAGNIRNIYVLMGYKEGFVTQCQFFTILKKISIHIFFIFTNSFSISKLKDFKRSVAVCETACQYGVFLVLTIPIYILGNFGLLDLSFQTLLKYP